LHQFAFTGSKQAQIQFPLEDIAQKANLEISLSAFPIDAFVKAFKYLLHYPYGCTEQLTSGLYPILVAESLYKK
jgi:uncharacterized protein YfaS (alpha-2-macroglobulin family)